MLRSVLCALTFLAVVVPSTAATEIAVYSDTAGQIKCISTPTDFQVVDTYIVITGVDPLMSVSFTVNMPPRLSWVSDVAVFTQTTGTSVLGATISFDACLEPPIHVLTIRSIVLPWDYSQGCPHIVIEQPVGLDCNGQPIVVTGAATRIVPGVCEIGGPSDPSPANQSEAVSIDALLEWTAEAAYGGCSLGDLLYFSLYFGTDPDPPLALWQGAFPPLDPGDLLPGTRYYWRILATQYNYSPRLSPVWSFRTAGPLAIETTTWGRVKALYRD